METLGTSGRTSSTPRPPFTVLLALRVSAHVFAVSSSLLIVKQSERDEKLDTLDNNQSDLDLGVSISNILILNHSDEARLLIQNSIGSTAGTAVTGVAIFSELQNPEVTLGLSPFEYIYTWAGI